MRAWRAMVLAAAAASVAVATPASAGSGPETVAETFINLAKETFAEDAAIVTLRARDRGYDLPQTLEGIGDGELAADGTITSDGSPVTPADPAPGVLAREGEDKVMDAINESVRRVERNRGARPPAKYEDVFMFAVLTGLMAEGYTLEQIIVDGLLAGGIDPGSNFLIPPEIVDEKGRRIEPGEDRVDDTAVEGVVRDMVAIVEGANPLDPEFEPRYDVSYQGQFELGGGSGTVKASGQLGTIEGGTCCLGRVRGKLVIPEGDECPGESVPITVVFAGLQENAKKPVELNQTWAYTGRVASSGSSGGKLTCITAAEAPELVGLLGSQFGPLRGVVRVGEKLDTTPPTVTLSIKKKR